MLELLELFKPCIDRKIIIMKSTIKLIAICAVLMTSCKKDIEMCIDGNMNPAEPGTYTYTWCGTNAENFEWIFSTTVGNLTYSGNSVTLNFDQKLKYTLRLKASNKKVDKEETFIIDVGTYEARIEPKECNGNLIQQSNSPVKAYLYADIPNLQSDLRNSDKANCIDSITLEGSWYFNNTTNSGNQKLVGGFENLASGNYTVYVQEEGSYPKNNLLELFVNGSSASFNVSNGDWDDIYNPTLTETNTAALLALFSKTYVLSEVWVNNINTGVSSCNADDNIIFNIDGSWLYDVGSDNCSGNQSNSVGSYFGFSTCSDPIGASASMTASSGSLASLNSLNMTITSSSQIDLNMYDGTNSIKQVFTAQ